MGPPLHDDTEPDGPRRTPTGAETAALLEQATAAQQAGDLNGAETACRALLGHDPGNARALELLGLVALARGEPGAAVESLGRAADRAPDSAPVHINLGNACHAAGRHDRALACYERAMALAPENPLAYLNAGILLHQTRGPAAAVGYYQLALSLAPDHSRAHFNLGNALTEMGNPAAAVDAYRNALRADQGYTDAWFNLGNALRSLKRLDDAEACYRAVTALCPEHAEAYNHLGQVLAQRRELPAAVQCYETALALRPTFAGTYNNLGNALKGLKRYDEAIEQYGKALELKPGFAEAHHNLASVLSEQGRFTEAIAGYEAALHHKADYFAAEANAITLRRQICDWTDYAQRMQRITELVEHCLARGEASPVDPFTALSLPFTPDLQRRVAARYAEDKMRRVASQQPGLRRRPPETRPDRLRIGYVSPNFRNHPTAHLMVRLFGLHDRSRFEIFTYTWGPDDGSDYRRRIAADSDHFVDLSDDSYLESAQRIADDGVHILVDRAGFTRDSRAEIFALRPAPVQVNYIGFPGSLGAEFIDYIVTDPVVSPAEQLPLLEEQPAYLPDCYLVTDPDPPVAGHLPTRAECGLPESGFVFCCFNTNYKIEPVMFERWMRILHQVPGSVLWLLRSNDQAADNLRREAARRGMDPARLVFADKVSKAEHLARHRLADLFLDTLHYNAHTTAVDSLWCGVPLITLPDDSFPSRVAASTLSAAGLAELIVPDLDRYEALAVALAAPGRIDPVKRTLLEAHDRCALFDVRRYTRHLEQAYERMWALHAGGHRPAPIEIDRLQGGSARRA